jgi:hypothetical protein
MSAASNCPRDREKRTIWERMESTLLELFDHKACRGLSMGQTKFEVLWDEVAIISSLLRMPLQYSLLTGKVVGPVLESRLQNDETQFRDRSC